VEWGLLVLITALAALLRFCRLGEKPLWLGEVQEITAARSPRFLDQVVDSGTDLVGFFWHHLVYLAGGEPLEFYSRLLAAFLGAMTIPVVYRLGSLLHSRRTGLVAGLLLAASFYHLLHCQDARSVSYLTFFSALSWLAMVEIVVFRKVRWAAVYVVAGGLAGLSHSIGGVYLVWQALFFIGLALFSGLKTGGREGTDQRAKMLLRFSLPALGALVIASYQLYVIADYGFAFSNTRPPVANTMGPEDLFLLKLWLVHLAGSPILVQLGQLALAVAGLIVLARRSLDTPPVSMTLDDRNGTPAGFACCVASNFAKASSDRPSRHTFWYDSSSRLARAANCSSRLLWKLWAYLRSVSLARTSQEATTARAEGVPSSWRAALVAVWFLGPSTTLYIVSARGTARLEMYHLLPCLVPFVLAVAAGLTAAVSRGLALCKRRSRAGNRAGRAAGTIAVTLASLLVAALLLGPGNYGQLKRYYDRPTRLFQGPDLKAVSEYLEALELEKEDSIFLNYSERMVTANFYMGRHLKRATTVVPHRPADRFWREHLLLRARFQATDSDVVRLHSDEIVAVDELPAGEHMRNGRVFCLLFWPEGSARQKGYDTYYQWLTGSHLYVVDRALDDASVPDGWKLKRFYGVDLLVLVEGAYTLKQAARTLVPLLIEFAHPMLKDMEPGFY